MRGSSSLALCPQHKVQPLVPPVHMTSKNQVGEESGGLRIRWVKTKIIFVQRYQGQTDGGEVGTGLRTSGAMGQWIVTFWKWFQAIMRC